MVSTMQSVSQAFLLDMFPNENPVQYAGSTVSTYAQTVTAKLLNQIMYPTSNGAVISYSDTDTNPPTYNVSLVIFQSNPLRLSNFAYPTQNYYL